MSKPHATMPTSIFEVADPPPSAARPSRCASCRSVVALCTCHLSDASHNVRVAPAEGSDSPFQRASNVRPSFHGGRRREQVCTVDGKWVDVPTPAEEGDGRIVWGAGSIGGLLREKASENPLLIHLFDNLAQALGVPVVDNTPNCQFTRLYVREVLDASGAFGSMFSGPAKLLCGGSYGPPGSCRVKLPDDAAPGQLLQLPVPPGWPNSGEMITFMVPSGAKAGDICYAPLPREEPTDQDLVESRPREVAAAAQSTRMKMLRLREAKSDAANAHARALLENGCHSSASAAPAAGVVACRAASTGDGDDDVVSEREMEVCAICQAEVSSGGRVLACQQCDNGFHVSCLNKWLLRADSCPCCRTIVGA